MSDTKTFTTTVEFKHTINTNSFPEFITMPEEEAIAMLDRMTKHFFKQPLGLILEDINSGNSGTFVEAIL